MEIKNQSAIVTGGASGMGAATAKMLSQAGAKVAIFDTNLTAAKKFADSIHGLAIECNVTDADNVAHAIETAAKVNGAARICINCAGNKDGPMPLADFEAVIAINLIGTFNLMRLTAAGMQNLTPLNDDGERGLIINTASVAAYEGQIGQAAYSASKGAIVSMTLPAARELGQFGIRVMTIAPGLVDTPMLQTIPAAARASLIENVVFPHRLVKAEEYAQLVKHIIENSMLNGEVIRLDGALRMQAR
jgi:NAD(P)-dependent dehydrogenase (short-subunit alcohol dehydrogenase family)